MLNDEQCEKLKKLLRIAFDKTGLYNWQQRGDANDDIAGIIDPENWENGICMKSLHHGRVSSAELNDVFKPVNEREFTPRRAEG